MSAPLAQILTLTLIPVAATILGGTVATFRTPSDQLRSLVQHFAAGVVFAAAAGELLPGFWQLNLGEVRVAQQAA